MSTGNFLVELGEDGLRQKIVDVAKDLRSRAWELAGLLYEVKINHLYDVWQFGSWEEYLETEVGLGRAAANQYIANWERYRLQLGVDLSDLKNLEYTKARVMKNIVNQDNVLNWIDKATSSSREELINEVRRVQSVASGDPLPDVLQPTKFITLAFQPEQLDTFNLAVQKAQNMSNSDVLSWNIDLICQSYLQSIDSRYSNVSDLLRQLNNLGFDVLAVDRSLNSESKISKITQFLSAMSSNLGCNFQAVEEVSVGN